MVFTEEQIRLLGAAFDHVWARLSMLHDRSDDETERLDALGVLLAEMAKCLSAGETTRLSDENSNYPLTAERGRTSPGKTRRNTDAESPQQTSQHTVHEREGHQGDEYAQTNIARTPAPTHVALTGLVKEVPRASR